MNGQQKQRLTRKTQCIHIEEEILREELRRATPHTPFSWDNGKLLQWKLELKGAGIHSKGTAETLTTDGKLSGLRRRRYSSFIESAGSQLRSSHLKTTSSELQDSNTLVIQTEKPASASKLPCFSDKNAQVNTQRNNWDEKELRAELEEYKLERHRLREELKRKKLLKETTLGKAANRSGNTLDQNRVEHEITGIKLKYADKTRSALNEQKIQLKDKYSKKLLLLRFSVDEINEQENKVLKRILEHKPKIATEENVDKEKLFKQQLAKITNEYERKVKNLTTRNSEIVRQKEELEHHLSSVEICKQAYTKQNALIGKELLCSNCKALC